MKNQDQISNQKDMISIDETAEILGISSATVKNWIKLDKLPAQKVTKSYLLNKETIINLKENLADSDLLKRRRNKSTANGQFIPKSYISKASQNYNTISSMIGALSGKCDISEKEILSIIAYYAESFLSALSLDDSGKKSLIAPICSEPCEGFSDILPVLKEYPLSYIEGEDTLGMLYISLRSLKAKKASGAYYTPFYVVDKCIENLRTERSETICDPSCGTGNFLLRLPKNIPLKYIYGYDIDSTAAAIARINLAVKYGIKNSADLNILFKNIKAADFLMPAGSERVTQEFDHIIGNPPWGYSYSKDEIKSLSEIYKCACVTGTPESFSIFTERALSLLSDGGTMSFVLPETLLGSGVHENIRSIIAEKSNITTLYYMGEIFDKVQCPCILLTLKTPHTDSFKTSVAFYKKSVSSKNNTDPSKGIFPERLVLTKSFETKCENLDTSSFHMLSDDAEKKVLNKIDEIDHFTLKDNCEFALGIVTGANKALLSPVKKAGYEEIIKGSEIDKYTIKEIANYIKYEPGKFQQIAPECMYRAKEKLLYKFICNKPVFAYDDRQRLSLNSANILIPKVKGYSALYILAVLNSPVLSFYYTHTCKNMKVLRSEIERLPIAKCDPATEREISELAKKILTSDKKARYITEINSRIAALYNLTIDELDIITKNE
ncbi:MAG: N-6 DNA methylase [Butyrivibrio sp.]|nr:N-6 DNA methylase [Butyrivibrio sp.]